MKYFLDTEFIEGFFEDTTGRKRHFVDLISIGIKCEDGRELYEVSSEYDYNDADDWVKKNVLKPMYDGLGSSEGRHTTVADFHKTVGFKNSEIAKKVKDFVMVPFLSKKPEIEFWAYFADYDWVVFCSLFGRMIDLPKGFPMFCMDLKQRMEQLGLTQDWKKKVCPDPKGAHNALIDARWNLDLFNAIEKWLSGKGK